MSNETNHEVNGMMISSPDEMQAIVERNKEGGWKDLTDQRKAFAMEYVINYDHRAAAKKVGFALSSGARLIKEPLIGAYISHLQELHLTSSIVTREFINSNYIQLLSMAMGREEIDIVLPNGEGIKATKTSIAEATSILKEMSKGIEYETPNVNAKNSDVSITIDFGNLIGDGSMDAAAVIESTAIVIEEQ